MAGCRCPARKRGDGLRCNVCGPSPLLALFLAERGLLDAGRQVGAAVAE